MQSLWMQIIPIITNPTVAYFLVLLGIYGIFFEAMHPGLVLPGVIGVISMVLALYALQFLPVNYAGFGLMIVGIIFIIGEGVTPSYGLLGAGGTLAFIIGSIMLIDTDKAAYQIAWGAICAMAVANILIFVVLLGMAIKARNQKLNNGLVMLVGATGRALGDIGEQGQAIIRGEIWAVTSKLPIAADAKIIVIATSGLILEVEEDKTTISDIN